MNSFDKQVAETGRKLSGLRLTCPVMIAIDGIKVVFSQDGKQWKVFGEREWRKCNEQ